MRGSLIETMGEDYIRTARAKGLPERRVVLRHGVRSAINPILTILALDIGVLLGGAVLVETVFNIPGIGRLDYDAITHADFPIIQGTVLLGALFIIVANIVVDIAYAYLDPAGALLVSPLPYASRCCAWRTCASSSRPKTASCTPSTGSPTRSSAGARSGSSASRARARPSPR